MITDEKSRLYATYREIDWKALITGADKSIDIAVYYWNKWTEDHLQELQQFLQKPGTKIRFVFADERIPELQKEILRLFPQTAEQLCEKIKMSYAPLTKRFASQVEVRRVPFLLNYSMQCFDGKILALSFFEMIGQERVDSPGLVVDLQANPKIKRFYEKEWNGLIRGSPL